MANFLFWPYACSKGDGMAILPGSITPHYLENRDGAYNAENKHGRLPLSCPFLSRTHKYISLKAHICGQDEIGTTLINQALQV